MENEKNNFNQLIHYMNKTWEMMNQGNLPMEMGHHFLRKMEPLVLNKGDLINLTYTVLENPSYWADLFTQNQSDILDFFEFSMQKTETNIQIFKLMVKKFLDLPIETRKEFYQNDFSEIRPVVLKAKTPDGQIKNVKINTIHICGRPQASFNTKENLFHNLASLYLNYEKPDDLFKKIITDMENTLDKNHSQLLDVYGKTIIHYMPKKELMENWSYYEMDKRKEFKQIWALKYYKTGLYGINDAWFLKDLKEKRVDYDIQLPKGKFVMESLISSIFNPIQNCFDAPVIDKKMLNTKLQEKKLILEKLKENYGQYFLLPLEVEKTSQLLQDKIQKSLKDDKEIVQNALDFILSAKSLCSGKVVKEVKKIKL